MLPATVEYFALLIQVFHGKCLVVSRGQKGIFQNILGL